MELELSGSRTLAMADGSSFDGPGSLVFRGPDSFTLFLGDPFNPNVASFTSVSFHNLRIDDWCSLKVENEGRLSTGTLNIQNRLHIENGSFDVGINDVRILASNTDTAGILVSSASAVIEGSGTFFISVQPASDSNGFPNTRADAFSISGDGFLNMSIDKNTDAGVRIELSELGTGKISFNRAGCLFVTEATQLSGSFVAESGSRTEFDALNTLIENIEIKGLNTQVYFYTSVFCYGDIRLIETYLPDTSGPVGGLFFMADLLAVSSISVLEGTFSAKGQNLVLLGASQGIYHNLEINGDVEFSESPTFFLEIPADASIALDLCRSYNVQAIGNKVIFGGNQDIQTLTFKTPLHISSVEINKDLQGKKVIVNTESSVFVIEKSLELTNGYFITNGLLKANNGATSTGGNTVSIHWGPTKRGVLLPGIAPYVYLDNTPLNTPRKVKYTGIDGIFTGAEIPGTPFGCTEKADCYLNEIEIALENDQSVVMLGKNICLTNQLCLTQGNLDLGAAQLSVANGFRIYIGNGEIRHSAYGFLVFPFTEDFKPGIDGIDLYYFGQKDRTVGPEWPLYDNQIIRNVTIDSSSEQGITISLSPDYEYTYTGKLELLDGELKRNNAIHISANNGSNPLKNIHQTDPLRIFISYSHKEEDKIYLDKLLTHLKPSMRSGSIEVWVDRDIKPGEEWSKKIDDAIENSNAALLLASPNFVASDYVNDNELPPILDAANKRGLKILWLPISYFAHELSDFANYQALSEPDKPLNSLSEHECDRVLNDVHRKILKLHSS